MRQSSERRDWANELAKIQRLFGRERIRQYLRLVGNPATGYLDSMRQLLTPPDRG
jgi:hypothetical protein